MVHLTQCLEWMLELGTGLHYNVICNEFPLANDHAMRFTA